MAQLFTAIAAFAGTATAIAVSSEAWAEERLLWITAGGFLYLAGTTMLPEVLADDGKGENGRFFRLAQLAAFCTGILFLSWVDALSGDHHGHGHNDDHSHHDHHDHLLHAATDNSHDHHQHAEL
jgi:zinc transporter ZupT